MYQFVKHLLSSCLLIVPPALIETGCWIMVVVHEVRCTCVFGLGDKEGSYERRRQLSPGRVHGPSLVAVLISSCFRRGSAQYHRSAADEEEPAAAPHKNSPRQATTGHLATRALEDLAIIALSRGTSPTLRSLREGWGLRCFLRERVVNYWATTFFSWPSHSNFTGDSFSSRSDDASARKLCPVGFSRRCSITPSPIVSHEEN
jgi:hypothetical protein